MGSKKQKTTSVQKNEWDSPQAQATLDASLSSILGGLQSAQSGNVAANNYLTNTINTQGINPYIEAHMRGIRAENDLSTPSLMAKQRSLYHNAPSAAKQFGMDEALRQNQVSRDNALYGALVPAYESSEQRRLGAAQLANTTHTADTAAALQLLDALKTSQTNSVTKQTGGDATQIAQAIASAVAAYYTMGASLAAQKAAQK